MAHGVSLAGMETSSQEGRPHQVSVRQVDLHEVPLRKYACAAQYGQGSHSQNSEWKLVLSAEGIDKRIFLPRVRLALITLEGLAVAVPATSPGFSQL